MRPTLVGVLLFSMIAPALAQDAGQGASGEADVEVVQGPNLGELLKTPAYFNAWQTMLASETPPDWLAEYTATLYGPPVPNIPIDINGQSYTLGFTCKPNDCEENQIYALFAPDGSRAWALMVTPAIGIVWLGYPDDRIQTALKGALNQ